MSNLVAGKRGTGAERGTGLPSRRDVLRIGALGAGGLTLPALLRLRAEETAAGRPSSDGAVIQIWCSGGPTQFETYDPKPEAPAEYAGPFRAVATRAPGMRISETLPRHAEVADRFVLVRSLAHDDSGHGSATKNVLSGYKHPPGTNEGTILHPTTGAVVAKCREHERRVLPNYVCVPRVGIRDAGFDHTGAAYLGPAYNPYGVDPLLGPKGVELPLELDARRLANRRRLLSAFDVLRRDADESGMMEGMDAFTRQAFEMVSGRTARDAMDLSLEPPATRALYGETGPGKRTEASWGQRCLAARRLVEAGVSFVTVVFDGWDDHGGVEQKMTERAPAFDRAVAALVEDLHARGLQRKVAVVVWGEFGRTPRLNKGGQEGVGRDHWSNSMSALLAGGGMPGGTVVGSTDSRGEKPRDRPLHPNDVWATLYRHLGIDPARTFPNNAGRPIPILSRGAPIDELT
jgi:uncharacterized protein (DUF1501 family)